ncbi:Pls/PosA family non-ribosomal peptide synthetase [Streptacidiphilus cavernicola]|uniref:Pls/PosA family non-ribosomal peptide synthetase n=1 Tax=Streptacidiphilus cavernicola TaxID=3342716 RepID=A0ABV6VPR2_9ACTN
MKPENVPAATLPQPRAGWPAAPAAPARTLVDILRAAVRDTPDAPALDADGAVLDYQGLWAAAGAVAARLTGLGIGRGDRVGVRIPSGTAELYTSILGVLAAGAAYVPVDVDDPDQRAELIWQDAGVRAVLGAGGTVRLAPGLAADPGSDPLADPPAGVGAAPAPGGEGRARGWDGGPVPGDDAWVIFTSGTTGRPKGVAVTHRSAAAFVDAEAGLFLRDAPLGRGDRVLAGLSVAFDASCEEMWLAWRHGACLVPAPRSLVRAGAELAPWLVEQGITALSTVPTLAALWPVAALDAVRLVIVGGEACPAELVTRLDRPHREFWNTYGPTETTVVACAALLRAGREVRIGTPLDGWEIAVVDPDGDPVGWGETGELMIGGVGAARYLDPLKDAERFGPHPALSGDRVYRSGDLVRADPAGLVFVGRADEQVKLGGRRVELGEVDAALAGLPGVRAAAAAVRDTASGGQVLVGYLVPELGAETEPAALRRLLLERLPAALVPVLAVLPELPTRTSGKVDRAALPWPLPSTLPPAVPAQAGGADSTGPGGGSGLRGTAARLAEQWRDLLGVSVDADADFFALGGTSLAAAQLVSALRERHPGLSVADLYRQPRLGDLAAHLELTAPLGSSAHPDRAEAAPAPSSPLPLPPSERRRSAPVPRVSERSLRWSGLCQALVLIMLQIVGAARWVLVLAALNNLLRDDLLGLGALGGHGFAQLPSWTQPTSWWAIGAGWLLLSSALGRTLLGAACARLLTLGLRPGAYRRGGRVHLRLWTAERLVAAFNVAAVVGTPLARRYARLLGCTVGPDADLHTMPPVTGLAEFGAGCSLEPEVDAAGWWLDGDLLRLGTITVGAGARVGTRAMLMPGAEIGPGAEVAPGSCVTGSVPAGTRAHGSPARPIPTPPLTVPAPTTAETPTATSAPKTVPAPPVTAAWPAQRLHRSRIRDRAWDLVYGLSLPALQLLPLLAAAPALLALYALLGRDPSAGQAFARLLLASLPLALLSRVLYALLLAVLVRLGSRSVRAGLHPAHGRVGWSVWLVHQLMGTARAQLFPLYASLATPHWLRLLGARIGRRVEASTALMLPGLTTVEDFAFLADDTLLAPFELSGGWLGLGPASGGRRSFVGNSAIVGPGRGRADDSLVGVLSDAPPEAVPGSSWLGRPGFPMQRVAETGDTTRTYDPPRRLVLARAAVELCRLAPTVCAVLLADLAAVGLQALLLRQGPLASLLPAGLILLLCGVAACALTTAAKWLLIGRFRSGVQPLWSSFVWRNELFDTFVEELAMPMLGSSLVGTPFLTLWLRSLGARIGHGVWCETHWLPETDLVELGDGCTLNRGVVVQTHLFHDRLMRMDRIRVGAGATVGPHSIVLLGAAVGDAAAVGPSSLVMRGESIPERSRWLGNPVTAWD